MFYKEVLLSEIDSRFTNPEAKLRIYISERNEAVELRPGMLVLPGGGYGFCSPREAEPIAFRFLSEGFNCFVLNYTVNKKYPAPHLELALVFKYIREHEKEFDLIPNSLSIVGFSAGGHLVGSYGYLYPELARELNVEPSLLRPLSVVMAYPVTSFFDDTHEDTKNTITGRDPDLIKKLDIPSHITKDYPPTFIWATHDDELVPICSTINVEKALKDSGVRYECFVFESGWHGASNCNRSCYQKESITPRMKDVRDWASKAADFIFNLIDKK